MCEKNLDMELSKDLNQHPFALQPRAYLYIHSYINSWKVEAICFMYLMQLCIFDVTENLEKFLVLGGTKQGLAL